MVTKYITFVNRLAAQQYVFNNLNSFGPFERQYLNRRTGFKQLYWEVKQVYLEPQDRKEFINEIHTRN